MAWARPRSEPCTRRRAIPGATSVTSGSLLPLCQLGLLGRPTHPLPLALDAVQIPSGPVDGPADIQQNTLPPLPRHQTAMEHPSGQVLDQVQLHALFQRPRQQSWGGEEDRQHEEEVLRVHCAGEGSLRLKIALGFEQNTI